MIFTEPDINKWIELTLTARRLFYPATRSTRLRTVRQTKTTGCVLEVEVQTVGCVNIVGLPLQEWLDSTTSQVMPRFQTGIALHLSKSHSLEVGRTFKIAWHLIANVHPLQVRLHMSPSIMRISLGMLHLTPVFRRVYIVT